MRSGYWVLKNCRGKKTVKETLDEVIRSNGFVIYNHPVWFTDHWPVEVMNHWRGENAIEIYNGDGEFCQGSAECTDKWDILLSSGYRVLGIATNDAYSLWRQNKGWVMVNALKDSQSILSALKAGHFYSSSCVTIDNIKVEGD